MNGTVVDQTDKPVNGTTVRVQVTALDVDDGVVTASGSVDVTGHLRVPIERDVLDCVIVGQCGYRTRRNLDRCRLTAIQTPRHNPAHSADSHHQPAVGSTAR